MPKDKYLRKNEIRKDLNPDHLNRFGFPHDAIITARRGHKYKANTRTHSKFVNGVECLDLDKNLPSNVPHRRISPPFWQPVSRFGDKKGKADRALLRKVNKYNRRFQTKKEIQRPSCVTTKSQLNDRLNF